MSSWLTMRAAIVSDSVARIEKAVEGCLQRRIAAGAVSNDSTISKIGDAATEHFLQGNFLGVDDSSGHKDDGSLAGFRRIGNRNAQHGTDLVAILGFEAQSAARHVDAMDDVVAESVSANASEEVDLGADTISTIRAGPTDDQRGNYGQFCEWLESRLSRRFVEESDCGCNARRLGLGDCRGASGG